MFRIFCKQLLIFIHNTLGDILNNVLEQVTLTSFTEWRELEKLFQKETGTRVWGCVYVKWYLIIIMGPYKKGWSFY